MVKRFGQTGRGAARARRRGCGFGVFRSHDGGPGGWPRGERPVQIGVSSMQGAARRESKQHPCQQRAARRLPARAPANPLGPNSHTTRRRRRRGRPPAGGPSHMRTPHRLLACRSWASRCRSHTWSRWGTAGCRSRRTQTCPCASLRRGRAVRDTGRRAGESRGGGSGGGVRRHAPPTSHKTAMLGSGAAAAAPLPGGADMLLPTHVVPSSAPRHCTRMHGFS